MADIFISYSRSDRSRVQPLVEVLEEHGWSVWWDRELIPGSAYEQANDDAISEARVVIVAWSQESVQSEWVQAEAGDGLDRHILVPVLLDDVRVPISFRRKHAARLVGFPKDIDEQEIRVLLKGIEDCMAGRQTEQAPPQAGPSVLPGGTARHGSRNAVFGAVAVALIGGLFYLGGSLVGIGPDEDPAMEAGNPVRSIAVLPFTGETQDRAEIGQLRFEINRALDRVAGLRMLSPDAADIAEGPVRTGRRLSVDFVVAGRVEGEGDRQVLLLKLFNTLNGGEIRSEELALSRAELTRVPGAAVRMVSRSLNLGGTAGREVEVSDEAYLAYLSGKAGLSQSMAAEAERARVAANFEKAIKLEPRFGAAYAGLCQLFIEDYRITSDTSSFDSAEKNCNRALTVDPDDGEVLTALGSLYRVSGLYDQAILNYERTIALKPFDTESMRGLAQVYTDMGMADRAEELLRTVISIEPAFWKNHRLLGSLYYIAGKYRASAEEFQLEAELNPNKAAPMLNLGSALFLDGDFEGATEAWKVSAAIEGDAAAYSNLGAAEFFSGDFDAAARMYERALDMQPRKHAMWGNAAEAYYFKGDDKHLEYYQTAYDLADERLQINPEDYDVLSAQAVYLAGLDKPMDALVVLDRALRQRGDDPFTWYDAARVHARSGDGSEALRALNEAFSLGYSRNLALADANFSGLKSEIGGEGQ
jgi:tetratricopeptide (TPR) repeat protein